MKKRAAIMIAILILTLAVGGWAGATGLSLLINPNNKYEQVIGRPVDYIEVGQDQLPQEISDIIDQKHDGMKIIVTDGQSQDQYVYIGIGTKRTAGYGVEIVNVQEVDEKVVVAYKKIAPAPGSFTAQVITYPWTAVKINSSLPIEAVEIR
jgi:hypothetical protein